MSGPTNKPAIYSSKLLHMYAFCCPIYGVQLNLSMFLQEKILIYTSRISSQDKKKQQKSHSFALIYISC